MCNLLDSSCMSGGIATHHLKVTAVEHGEHGVMEKVQGS